MPKNQGNYVELTLGMIEDGLLEERLTTAIRNAYAELDRHEKETGATTGKAQVALKLVIHRSSKEYVGLAYELKTVAPGRKHSALVRGGGGRLLADPDGDDLNDGNQLVMTFDRFGQPQGEVNLATGEVADADDQPVGKVGGA